MLRTSVEAKRSGQNADPGPIGRGRKLLYGNRSLPDENQDAGIDSYVQWGAVARWIDPPGESL
jgi:hypothetical protein